jgi:hypothetical protein
MGRRVKKGAATPIPKVAPFPALTSILFTTLTMAFVSFTTTTHIGPQVYFTLYLVGKLKSRRTLTCLAATSKHATAMAMLFPANAGLIFLTNELTRDRYLVDTGATLSIVPCNSKTTASGPLLKGADGQPIPSWGFVQFQGRLFSLQFL